MRFDDLDEFEAYVDRFLGEMGPQPTGGFLDSSREFYAKIKEVIVEYRLIKLDLEQSSLKHAEAIQDMQADCETKINHLSYDHQREIAYLKADHADQLKKFLEQFQKGEVK